MLEPPLRSWKIILNNAGVPFTFASVPPCGLPNQQAMGSHGIPGATKVVLHRKNLWETVEFMGFRIDLVGKPWDSMEKDIGKLWKMLIYYVS